MRVYTPSDVIRAAPDVRIRAACLALSVASLILPLGSATSLGLSVALKLDDPVLAGGWAYVLPIVFAVAIAAPLTPAISAWTRVADHTAVALAGVATGYSFLSLQGARNEISHWENGLARLVGKQDPSFVSYSLEPGFWALLILLFLSAWNTWRAWHRAPSHLSTTMSQAAPR